MNRRWGRVAAMMGALTSLCGATAVQADVEARRWLADTTEALSERSYSGDFLHLGNGPVEKLRILHRVHDGHLAERLLALGGGRREVLRNDDEMQVILADQSLVLVEEAPAAGSLLGSVPTFEAGVDDQYQIEFAGSAHVIGRPTRVVAVLPRDGYRFGYRLWIDEATRIPLRTDLTDGTGHVLEQVVFTSLDLAPVFADGAFHPSIDASRFPVVRENHPPAEAGHHSDDWTFSRLPPGYRVLSRTQERLPGTGVPAIHFLIGDGLASVSVFIEEPPAPPRQVVQGEGKFGSAYAYSRVTAGHQVTAVGEVPLATVEWLAGAVTPSADEVAEFRRHLMVAPLAPARAIRGGERAEPRRAR